MTKKDEYLNKQKVLLQGIDAEIDLLKARAKKAKTEAQIELLKQVDELRNKKDAIHKKLDELKNAQGKAWNDLNEGLENALSELRSALGAAKNRFKS